VRLHLEDNHIRCLPPSIGMMVSLQDLYLAQNRFLEALPYEFASTLPQLRPEDKAREFTYHNFFYFPACVVYVEADWFVVLHL
jgi:hypothetical protein